MSDTKGTEIAKFVGMTLGIVLGDLSKAALFYWIWPSVAVEMFPGLVASHSVIAQPSFVTCLSLVLCVSFLAPLKTLGITTPMKVQDVGED